MSEAVHSNSITTQHKLIKEFASANMTDSTDLTIRLGDNEWNVHSELMKANSGYFRVLCNGEWMETKSRVVKLKEGDPWHFARLLQFVYYGSFQDNFDPMDTNERRMTLSELVKVTDPKDKDADDSRSWCDIYIALIRLADYFDIPSLRLYCGSFLVQTLISEHCNTFSDTVSPAAKSAKDFCDVYEMLQPYFMESEKMGDLETSMIDILIRRKIDTMQGGKSILIPFKIMQSRSSTRPAKEDVVDLRNKVRRYAKESNSFACKMAERLEVHYERACQSLAPTKKSMRHLLLP